MCLPSVKRNRGGSCPSPVRPDRRATRPDQLWSQRAACSQYRGPHTDCQLSSQFATMSLVTRGADTSGIEATPGGLGAALRRAWLGYQLRLDRAMAEAGFGERGFPDGRVLRMCAGEAGSTISAIGRELGITRQGASKAVAHLCDRGYVVVADSTTSKREKSVVLTRLGVDYLAQQRTAARAIEDELRAELGDGAIAALGALLVALDTGEGVRLPRTSVAHRACEPTRLESRLERSDVTKRGCEHSPDTAQRPLQGPPPYRCRA